MHTAWKYIVAGLMALVLAGLTGCNPGGSSTDLAQNVPGDPDSGSEDGGQTFIDEPTGGPMPGDEGDSGGGSEDDGGGSDGGGGSDSGGGGGDGSGNDDGGSGEDPGDPVPEPTTVFLIGSGLAGMAYYRKRRREGDEEETEDTPAA